MIRSSAFGALSRRGILLQRGTFRRRPTVPASVTIPTLRSLSVLSDIARRSGNSNQQALTCSSSNYDTTTQHRSFSVSRYEPADSDRAAINDQAREPQTSVSLQALMRTGRGEYLDKTFGLEMQDRHAATALVLIQVASFLRRELPIRLAHRIQDLEGVPVLRDMNSVKSVRDAYIKSFFEIMAFDTKVQRPEQEEVFLHMIEKIHERRSAVLLQMARGAYNFRRAV
jgi:hypothetical protein